MKSIELNIEKALGTVSKSDIRIGRQSEKRAEMLHKGTGKEMTFRVASTL